MQACDVVAEIAKPEFKARMTVKLAVAGAFHTDYMAPAVDKLKEALANTTMTTPRLPVVSNVDAMPHSDPDVIKDILARQASFCLYLYSNTCACCIWILCQPGPRTDMFTLPFTGYQPRALGEHAADVAGEGARELVRDWAQQGDRRDHEAD